MDAPDAVSVALDPPQIVGLVAVTAGRGSTVTLFTDVLLQPFASIPVTVYAVVTVGDTLTVGVAGPIFQL